MKHYRTSKGLNERFKEQPCSLSKIDKGEPIFIDTTIQKQTILGFGGAFTEASAYNLKRVNKELRQQAIEAYFDPDKGLGYQLGRISIHGCDFSLGSYLYIDDYDDTLSTFSIKRDQTIIELIKDAQKVLKKPISLVASPWTPPFWMKDNHSPIFGGKLLSKYDQTWADYFVKFIRAYENEGLSIFAVTIQNEPMAVQRWDSCIFENEEELRFLKVLGKTLEEQGLKDCRIFIWDHNRDMMVERASHIYRDKEASKYAWGTAFHWYDQNAFDEVKKHHELFPDKHLLFTEGCQENGPHLHDYQVAERYGRNMMHDLRNWTEGYIDWNLFLDDTGGPNHVNNLCSAPIIIKIFHQELVKNPSYYYIGHFSKFIKPGAIQVESSGTESCLYFACINPDKSQVLVVQNESDKEIPICVNGFIEPIEQIILPHSISTFILNEQ